MARKSNLVKDLEKLASQTQDESKTGYSQVDDEVHFKGLLLGGEGYDRISWPGTARVSQYRLYSDGILKINIFMGEEDARVTDSRLYKIEEFSKEMKTFEKKTQSRIKENIKKALAK